MPFTNAHYRREATVKAYPVPLTDKVIEAFIGFAKMYMLDPHPYELKHIRVECKFNPTQYSSFSGLAHHGLITHAKAIDARRQPYTGWILTQRGKDFFMGKISIYSVAGAWRGEAIGDTIPEDSETWENWSDSNKYQRRKVFITEVAQGFTPQRADYAQDKHDALQQDQSLFD